MQGTWRQPGIENPQASYKETTKKRLMPPASIKPNPCNEDGYPRKEHFYGNRKSHYHVFGEAENRLIQFFHVKRQKRDGNVDTEKEQERCRSHGFIVDRCILIDTGD